jgi:L-2-hydroxyglutarate oxidase LhgO
LLAKGNYFSLSGKCPFSHLIYPVPEVGGLGVHLTLDLAGQAKFGPDVQWTDTLDYSVDDKLSASFAERIRAYWPGIDASRLHPAYAGIRPKLRPVMGQAADFRIDGPNKHGTAGLIHLFGIESPGLTASLAIAAEVRRALDA